VRTAPPRPVSRRKPAAYRCPVCKDAFPKNLRELEAEANLHRVTHALEGAL